MMNLEQNLRWIIERERAGTGRTARVAVFADAGVWHLGVRSIVAALEAEGVPCRVIVTSSPASTSSTSFERLSFASAIE